MNPHIDQSLYPEMDDPPVDFPDDFDRADYLHRVCTAWDFGIAPHRETFDLLQQWKTIFDSFPVLASPAYHALRRKFGWEELSPLCDIVLPTPRWLIQDRLEGRAPDPCEKMI